MTRPIQLQMIGKNPKMKNETKKLGSRKIKKYFVA